MEKTLILKSKIENMVYAFKNLITNLHIKSELLY